MIQNALILNQVTSCARCTATPTFLSPKPVDKAKAILLELCDTIETTSPADLDAFYALTHAATHRVNELEPEFEAAGSELETGAREAIAEDFAFIASAYMYEANVEEMISPRSW